MMLEFSQYLEKYLWPNYKRETATHAHLMSIVAMVNEKFRERVEVWPLFEAKPEEFPAFFRHVLETCLPANDSGKRATMREKTALLVFLNHCFNSMEIELCREQAKRLVSLSMWSCLQPSEYIFDFCYVKKLDSIYFGNSLQSVWSRSCVRCRNGENFGVAYRRKKRAIQNRKLNGKDIFCRQVLLIIRLLQLILNASMLQCFKYCFICFIYLFYRI